MTTEIQVTLDPYEARALASMAGILGDILPVICQNTDIQMPDDRDVPPLVTAQMKLEVALALAGAER
jgi:hypothetical protein